MKSIIISLITITFFLSALTISAHAQLSGCTDRLANNYDPTAKKNNGTCTYNISNYTPPVKVKNISNVLNESSGLQFAANGLWSFNDGGGLPAIYKIDTESNALLQTVRLENATNEDWEDIGFDGTFFYIGDFGNNFTGARTDLKIYKFPLSAIPDNITHPDVTIASDKIETINFRYQNQPNPIASGLNNTRFDCEAMIIDKGKIHLFSKNWVDLNTTHYVINGTSGGTYIADSVETIATNFLVTGADKAPGQDVIVLIGYVAKPPGKHFMEILSDYSGSHFFNGNKRKLNLPDALTMGQAEGITFRNDHYGYISNERLSAGPFSVKQKLRSFNISNYVNGSSSGSLRHSVNTSRK